MSSTTPAVKPPNNFELETKIRLIIKELLEATSNKLSDFTQRIDGYEKYYFTFTDRVARMEHDQRSCREEIDRLVAHVNTTYEKMNSMEVRSKERLDKSSQLFEKLSEGFTVVKDSQDHLKKQMDRLVRECLIQNDDVSRTKHHYIEQKKLIEEYREDASERILKFVERNVEINREVSSKFDELNREVDMLKLAFERSKKHFDECFDTFREQELFNSRTHQLLDSFQRTIQDKASLKDIQNNNKEVKQWVEERMHEIEKLAISKVESVVNNHKGLQSYGERIQRLGQRLQHTESQLNDSLRSIVTRTTNNETKAEAKLEKLIAHFESRSEEMHNELTKRLDDTRAQLAILKTEQSSSVLKLKSELEIKLQQETSQLMESKSKKTAISEEMMQQLEKTRRNDLLRVEGRIAQVEAELASQTQQLEARIDKSASNRKYTSESTTANTIEVNKQLHEALEDHTEKLSRLAMKVEYLEECNNRTQQHQLSVDRRLDEFFATTVTRIDGTEMRCAGILAENQATVNRMLEDYATLKVSVQQKMETVSSSVTKCRSDVVMIGDSFAMRFQQLVRKHDTEQKKTQGILKVVPMIGECLNLLLALCFDTEYENSRIFFDAVPSAQPEQFSTLNDGKLYEFKQKRKPGTVYYRNRTVKKTDLVKAHLSSFIDVWDGLQNNEFREQFTCFPKDFFKSTVEKKLKSLMEQDPFFVNPEQADKPNALLQLQQPMAITLKAVEKLPVLPQQATKVARVTEPVEDKITDVNGRTFQIRQQMSVTQKKMSVSFVEGASRKKKSSDALAN